MLRDGDCQEINIESDGWMERPKNINKTLLNQAKSCPFIALCHILIHIDHILITIRSNQEILLP